MTGEKNWFERFSQLMEQNIRGVQYGIYTISGLALFVAVRTVRPVSKGERDNFVAIGMSYIPAKNITHIPDVMTEILHTSYLYWELYTGLALNTSHFVKFVRPSDIPKHFLHDKQSFIGKVIKVEYSSEPGRNPLLLVDHYPLIPLPWKKTNVGLPVEVAGVELTLNGLSWMQSVLVGDQISFTPLKIDRDRVHSILYNSERRNVGCQLVSIGLATVSEMDSKLKKDPFYLKYYKNLLAEEEKAEINRAGIWANSEVSSASQILRKLFFFRKKPQKTRGKDGERSSPETSRFTKLFKSVFSSKSKV